MASRVVLRQDGATIPISVPIADDNRAVCAFRTYASMLEHGVQVSAGGMPLSGSLQLEDDAGTFLIPDFDPEWQTEEGNLKARKDAYDRTYERAVAADDDFDSEIEWDCQDSYGLWAHCQGVPDYRYHTESVPEEERNSPRDSRSFVSDGRVIRLTADKWEIDAATDMANAVLFATDPSISFAVEHGGTMVPVDKDSLKMLSSSGRTEEWTMCPEWADEVPLAASDFADLEPQNEQAV